MQSTTFDNLIQAVSGKAVGLSVGATFSRIQTDSRNVQPGDVFWALRGERFDGHEFVSQAFEKGAIASLVSHEYAACHPQTHRTIAVHDTKKALQQFARWHRLQWGGPVVGVTGSCGKTTTREAIHSTLSATLTGCQSLSNNNNHFGVPFTLLDIEPNDQFAVVECGASTLGEMRELVSCCLPNIGVITGVSNAHLEGFGSLQGVYAEKTEMVRSLASNELAILSGDSRKLQGLASQLHCRTLLVGEGSGNDVHIENVRLVDSQVLFQIDRETYRLPLAGKHYALSGAIAVAVAREFGLTAAQIKEGLLNTQPVPGRCQIERFGPWTVINDTYNANPASALAACRLLRDWEPQQFARKHLVLGDMLELGARSTSLHRELGRQIAVSGIDNLYTFGRDAENIVAGAVEEGFPSLRTNASNSLTELCIQLVGNLGENDVVLVKGSRGTRMERVVDYLRSHANYPTIHMARAA